MATTVSVGTGSGGIGTMLATIFLDAASSTAGAPSVRPPVISNANSPLDVQFLNLANGVNTISINAKAGAVLIIPPSASAVALTLKGVSGDTGIGISPKAPTLISFPSTPPANIVITAGGTVAGVLIYGI